MGREVSGKFFFRDGLEYGDFPNESVPLDVSKWEYCIGKDRRFHTEVLDKIRPAGWEGTPPCWVQAVWRGEGCHSYFRPLPFSLVLCTGETQLTDKVTHELEEGQFDIGEYERLWCLWGGSAFVLLGV